MNLNEIVYEARIESVHCNIIIHAMQHVYRLSADYVIFIKFSSLLIFIIRFFSIPILLLSSICCNCSAHTHTAVPIPTAEKNYDDFFVHPQISNSTFCEHFSLSLIHQQQPTNHHIKPITTQLHILDA